MKAQFQSYVSRALDGTWSLKLVARFTDGSWTVTVIPGFRSEALALIATEQEFAFFEQQLRRDPPKAGRQLLSLVVGGQRGR